MGILNFFILLAGGILFLFLLPSLFPICSCCKKLKVRPLFKIHKTTGFSPGYGSKQSICKSCCIKYGIDDIHDFNQVARVMRKVEIELLKFEHTPEGEETYKRSKRKDKNL